MRRLLSVVKRLLVEAGAEVLLFPNTSVNALFSALPSVKPDLTLIYWSPVFPNVPEYLTALLSASRPVPNFTLFSDERLDRLTNELRRPGAERDENLLLKSIGEVLGDQMPWIPLYIETPLALTAPYVKNFAISPVSIMLLTDVRLVRP